MIEVNKIYTGNSVFTLAEMQSEFVDLTVTSPPYDKLRAYNGFSFPFKHIARHLFRVTKTGGIVVWVVGDSTVNGSETGNSFRQALHFIDCGFRLHDTQIYKKANFIPLNHNRYEQEFEYIFVFSKGKPKTFNPIMVSCKTFGASENFKRKGYGFKEGAFRRRDEVVTVKTEKIHGNIFEYATGASGKNHPAVFPEQLAYDQIITWSNEGDLIYDPFSGSGTTCKVADGLGRNYIGSEISHTYAKESEKYINQHKGLFSSPTK